MELPDYQKMQRLHEFDGPIAHIARQSASVRMLVDHYAHGSIVTKEEALSRMILALWQEVQFSRNPPPGYISGA